VLFNALRANRVTPKVVIGNSPFFLVYGGEVILPPHIFLPSLQLSQIVQEIKSSTMEDRINALLKLEEQRQKAKTKLNQHQQLVKRWFDNKYSSNRDLDVGDSVLKWDKAHEDKGNTPSFRDCGWDRSLLPKYHTQHISTVYFKGSI